jgi:hypothetical protein
MNANQTSIRTAASITLSPTPLEQRHPEDIESTDQIAVDYNIPRRILMDLRISGGGPPYIKVSHKCVRYRRGPFEEWLAGRTKQFTQQSA